MNNIKSYIPNSTHVPWDIAKRLIEHKLVSSYSTTPAPQQMANGSTRNLFVSGNGRGAQVI